MIHFRLPSAVTSRLHAWAMRRIEGVAPDEPITIGGRPYLDRWFVLRPNRWFNVFIHRFRASDEDRALHDHPWGNASIVLDGMYKEITDEGFGWTQGVNRAAGDVVLRGAQEKHRVELYSRRGWSEIEPEPVLTIFIRLRKWREWGFICKDGRWFHWRHFLAGEDRSDWSLCETDVRGDRPGRKIS